MAIKGVIPKIKKIQHWVSSDSPVNFVFPRDTFPHDCHQIVICVPTVDHQRFLHGHSQTQLALKNLQRSAKPSSLYSHFNGYCTFCTLHYQCEMDSGVRYLLPSLMSCATSLKAMGKKPRWRRTLSDRSSPACNVSDCGLSSSAETGQELDGLYPWESSVLSIHSVSVND